MGVCSQLTDMHAHTCTHMMAQGLYIQYVQCTCTYIICTSYYIASCFGRQISTCPKILQELMKTTHVVVIVHFVL